jgi:putative DNA primase/helicase
MRTATTRLVLDGHRNDPVEVAVRLWVAGFRPVPLDPATGRSLVAAAYGAGDGEVEEDVIRSWWFDRPDAALGILHADGTVRACTPEAIAAEEADARRRRLGKEAKNRTDLGNAARLVLKHGDDLRYVPAWWTWLLWAGTHWRRDDALEVLGLGKAISLDILFIEAKDEPDDTKRTALIKWGMASQTRQRIEAMVNLARPDVAVTPDRLDRDPWLLACPNGTLDLKTGRLRPARREDLITRCAPVAFDPAAACPRWLAFLDRVMADNEVLIAYLQRVAGMCLTADVREQALFIFHGKGANGKSVFLDTLTGLMGDYAGEAAPDLLVIRRNEEHACEVADLKGRRLVVAGETEGGARLRVQLLKRLTGNARIKARFMRENYFEFPRTHKLILQTNNKPVIREGTHAVWRRIRLVPFGVIIPDEEQDRLLTEKLRAEWPGILNWLVEGCLAWEAGGLQTPEEVENATQTYEDEQDLLGEFAEEILIFAPRTFVTRSAAWAAYVQWGQDHREKYLMDRNEFYIALRRRPGVTDDERRVAGKNVRGFAGVGLAPTSLWATEPAEAAEEVAP